MPETSPSPSSSWPQRLPALLPPDSTRLFATAIAVLAVVVGGAVLLSAFESSPPPVEVSLPRADSEGGSSAPDGPGDKATAESEPQVYVHAAGAVGRPGVYRLGPGARVADVIDAAGGPGLDADLNQLNLAAKVGDGERVYVPRRGEAPPPPLPGTGTGPSAGTTGPVDLNTATLEQLEALPGIGPSTAQAILDHRKEHGRFRSVDQLLEVRGIGQAKLASLRSRVRV